MITMSDPSCQIRKNNGFLSLLAAKENIITTVSPPATFSPLKAKHEFLSTLFVVLSNKTVKHAANETRVCRWLQMFLLLGLWK